MVSVIDKPLHPSHYLNATHRLLCARICQSLVLRVEIHALILKHTQKKKKSRRAVKKTMLQLIH